MEEDQECVMCHEYNDQMLMLTCVHDPCISCAASSYLEEARGKANYYVPPFPHLELYLSHL
jgi:hypothetical protein